MSHEHFFVAPTYQCASCFLTKEEIENGVPMNLYDDKQKLIGEVNFQMGYAHVKWKENDQQHQLVIPNDLFDAIKRLEAKPLMNEALKDLEAGNKAREELAQVKVVLDEHCAKTRLANDAISPASALELVCRSRENLLEEKKRRLDIPEVEELHIPGLGQQEVVSAEVYRRVHDHLTRIDLMVDRFCADQDISVKEGVATADVLESILIDIAAQDSKPAIDDKRPFTAAMLSTENKSLKVHLEELKKRNRELGDAVNSLRRQRDVRTKMLNAVLLDELDDHG